MSRIPVRLRATRSKGFFCICQDLQQVLDWRQGPNFSAAAGLVDCVRNIE
jgi:hypothetical protein